MNKKILGIGNAIIDIFVQVSDEYLKKNNLHKGSMKLITENEFNKLISNIKIKKIVAGGSAANTMAGISYLNGNSFFIGKINNDVFGNLYKKSLEDAKVKFSYNKKKETLSTGASIILITPDSERTMCTYLGISSQLSADDIKKEILLDKELIFLEGYLWDKGISERMFKHVIKIAKTNKIKIAMSLSDIFCVQRHKKDFLDLLKNDLDILIGNEKEIIELTNSRNLLAAVDKIKNTKKLIIITRSEKGSLAINDSTTIECESYKVRKILDLTGAGDLFAAGFLNEYVNNQIGIKKCLNSGSILASKIIQKIGARIN